MDIQSGLGSLCRLISMKSTKRFHAWLAERGVVITPEQAYIIASVAKSDEFHQSELMSLTFLASDKSKISRIVQSLVTAGYLSRSDDEVDRRSKILRLTPEGVKVALLLKEAANINVELYNELFTEEELKALQTSLVKVLNAL
ncbi:MarR family winged helix-turn-helix transcriptional regulator [Aliivibrio fischeri]|uniref:MarR family winged helix-turn-helix transcriptional regulator n=1 Tax=Aliivibrio fischeri TaxID=668 RepID=UPI0012DA2F36|nr:MarR family winged helix-turn-helix transcriptional regulator [Aliivibrio fischeri]MUJ25665.1 winged helix DNA-binding protein [Aliivibrio fischeri]